MKSVLNKAACREYALEQSKQLRNGRFKRVSKDFLDMLESSLRAKIAAEVHRAPSVGITL